MENVPSETAKADGGDYVGLRNRYASKETGNRAKMPPTEWGQILVNLTSDERIISRKKKQPVTQLKNGPRTRTGFSPKQTYKWPAS